MYARNLRLFYSDAFIYAWKNVLFMIYLMRKNMINVKLNLSKKLLPHLQKLRANFLRKINSTCVKIYAEKLENNCSSIIIILF